MRMSQTLFDPVFVLKSANQVDVSSGRYTVFKI